MPRLVAALNFQAKPAFPPSTDYNQNPFGNEGKRLILPINQSAFPEFQIYKLG
jgi:hypothetical protein